MKGLTVQELARKAGVSVRTLHHYDEIALLRPESRSASGYRLYGPAQLLRLQHILFYRELDFPLEAIGRLLDDPDFDPPGALRAHRATLEARLDRLRRLLDTLDKTVAHYEENAMITEDELYAGFEPEEAEALRREARERWGEERVDASERKARGMTRAQWEAQQKQSEAVNAALRAAMGRDVDDPVVRAAVAGHRAWIENFWTPDAASYRGLGEAYRDDPRFRAYYEKVAPGLADFLCRAIARYCEDFPARAK
jgi:DNA-binding transcriptional MerR regulator